MKDLRIIFVYTSKDPALQGAVRVASAPVDGAVSPFLPANCQLLRRITENRIRDIEGAGRSVGHVLQHCELSAWFDAKGEHHATEQAVRRTLLEVGVRRLRVKDRPQLKDWLLCDAKTAKAALSSLKGTSAPESETKAPKKTAKGRKAAAKPSHGAADALDWAEAMRLIKELFADGRYRDCLLVACGCFLGLRISDLLTLRWSDLHGTDTIYIREKKTGKKRAFKINGTLRKIAEQCHAREEVTDDSSYLFASPATAGEEPITRQRADQILKECKQRYGITSAKTFSTHSLRKTFGRRVWLVQCDKGKGDQALLLLCDVFGHSSIAITKRYLGIRQEEILSVYDTIG